MTQELLDNLLSELERDFWILRRRDVVSQEEGKRIMIRIRRCVRLWRKGGRSVDWIANQLRAARQDLTREFGQGAETQA